LQGRRLPAYSRLGATCAQTPKGSA
jgi:hypothetical protein